MLQAACFSPIITLNSPSHSARLAVTVPILQVGRLGFREKASSLQWQSLSVDWKLSLRGHCACHPGDRQQPRLPLTQLSAGWRASGGLGKGAVPPPRYRGLGKVIATEMWVPLLRATSGLLLGADRVEWSRDRSSPSSPTPSPGHPWPHQCQTGCLQCSPTCGLISRLLLEPNGFGFIAHLAPVEPPRESVFPLCVCIQLSYKGQKT